MQRHLDKLRQQDRESLKFLIKRRGRNTPMWSLRKQNKKYTPPQRKDFSKIFLLEPEASSVSAPSIGTRQGAIGKDRSDLTQKQSLGQSSDSPTTTYLHEDKKLVQQTMKDTSLKYNQLFISLSLAVKSHGHTLAKVLGDYNVYIQSNYLSCSMQNHKANKKQHCRVQHLVKVMCS